MLLNPSLKLVEIANIINAEVIGDVNVQITGINEIHKVGKGDITFVDHPKYYKKALESNASVIIINNREDCPEGKALLLSDDPFRDYVLIVKHFNVFITLSNIV